MRRPRYMGANKYHAKKIDTEAGKFDSQVEYKRWCYLSELKKNGEINNLIRQISYTLVPTQYGHDGKCVFREMKYTSDIEYDLLSGEHIVEDVKGIILPEFKLKRKLMMYFFGIYVHVVKYKGGKWEVD